MEQQNPSASESLPRPAPQEQPDSQPDQAPPSAAQPSDTDLKRLTALQHAFLLDQLTVEGAERKSAGELNRRIPAAARRQLQLNHQVANKVRRELADLGYLDVSKKGQKVFCRLTEKGQAYLAGLERPTLSSRAKRLVPVDEATIPDDLREGQKAYLLLQLFEADGQSLTKGAANKIKKSLSTSLGLKPAVANYRRGKLVEQGYIRITSSGRNEQYALTPDGLDYLAAAARHLEHLTFQLKGKTLNALVAAARESSFDRHQAAGSTAPERPLPTQAELTEAVLAEFQELRRERHGRSGLVPIHEVRQRLADRFGPAVARHDVLDDVILGLWRQKRLGLEAISDLSNTTEQQLNDSIPGVHGTLFYLEAPHGQPFVPEPIER